MHAVYHMCVCMCLSFCCSRWVDIHLRLFLEVHFEPVVKQNEIIRFDVRVVNKFSVIPTASRLGHVLSPASGNVAYFAVSSSGI